MINIKKENLLDNEKKVWQKKLNSFEFSPVMEMSFCTKIRNTTLDRGSMYAPSL